MKLFYLLLIILISSCTITKRIHQSGYHVQWNKQKSPLTDFQTLSSSDNTIESSPIEEQTYVKESPFVTNQISETVIKPTKKPTISSHFQNSIIEKVDPQLSSIKNNTKKEAQKIQLNEKNPTEISESSNIANILAILSFVLICVSILFLPIVPLLPFITFISSLPTAICSLIIGKKNPENYKRKRFAIASIWIVSSLFLIGILIGILMARTWG
jgi:hypothetical protein